MKKYIWAFVLVLLVSSSNLFAQPPLCPPLKYGEKWSKGKKEAITRIRDHDLITLGTVDYWANESHEYVFDWTTFKNISGFMDDETVKQLLIGQFLNDFDADGGEIEIKIISQTPCTVDLKCVLNVDRNYTDVCCDVSDLPPVNTYRFDGKTVIDVWHTVECGYKCCQQRYIIKGAWDSFSNTLRSWVDATFPIEPMPGSECNTTTTYFDCITGQPKTCEGYCK